MEGWVLEATAGERARMWWSGIEAMAEVHRTDWRSLDLGWLVPPGTTPGLDAQLDYYAVLGLDRPGSAATDGRGGVEVAGGQPAGRERRRHALLGRCPVGNIIWQDFDAAAVIDWEMATLAQPELDLGWWLYFDRQFTEGLGVERPSGFPSHEATVERYGELLGRDFGDLFWYQVFSGFRFAVVMCRLSTCWSARACCRASRTWGPTTSPPSSSLSCSTCPRRPSRLRAGRTTSVGPVRAGSVRRGDGDARVAEALGEPLGAVGLLHGLEPPA